MRRPLAFLPALALLLAPALALADARAESFERAVRAGNVGVALALAFGAGVLTSLTPCVYPMIPITVSVFGAKQSSRWRGFLLSFAFVEGISAMFTSLGILAAMSGNIFGAALTSPWVVGTIAALFVAMSLSMFGAFELTLPSSLQTRLAGIGGRGYGGAFLMGLVAGVIASPCTGPVLNSILAVVAADGRVGYGAALLLAFSHGLGLLFLLVGTFAVSLPKPGRWMESVKSVFGIVFLGAAAYFVAPHVPAIFGWVVGETWFLFGAVALVGLGIAIGAVHLTFAAQALGQNLRKATGLALSVVGLVGMMGWFQGPTEASASGGEGFAWIESEPRGISRARAERRPVLIDFTANWCAACKELAKDTFPAREVQDEADRFVAIRIDSTSMDDGIRALHERYGVRGLPTVLLLDSRGRERRRVTGFVAPREFARYLRAVQ
jgi:thiol:disulfide interchange protein DsbD